MEIVSPAEVLDIVLSVLRKGFITTPGRVRVTDWLYSSTFLPYIIKLTVKSRTVNRTTLMLT